MTERAVLRTERLVLRSIQGGDEADALAYRDDGEFARYLPHVPQPFTMTHAIDFVTSNTQEPWATSPTFAVVLDARVIGTVSFEVDAEAKRSGAVAEALYELAFG